MMTHVVITNLKEKFFITEKENLVLMSVSLDDWFELKDGTRIKGSNIAAILPIKAYYNQHPEERPEEIPVFQAPAREEYVGIEKQFEHDKRVTYLILSGLKKFCDENTNAKNAKALYDQKLTKYKQRFDLV